MPTDTIHALASGTPPAGVAVVRVSGPLVPHLVEALIGRDIEPRRATLAALRSSDGRPLDQALVLRFPGPRSFTGEDVLELHCHGGRAVVNAVCARLIDLGSRPAEPGEFTMRAHRNGRIDLVEAERLADLIEAETEAQRAFAASGRGRRNAVLYEQWRGDLLDARALVEVSLDFADEDEAPAEVGAEVAELIEGVRSGIARHLANEMAGRIVRTGYRVVLAGPPNAGKSTLLNALAEDEVAIVTPVPGTTRDAIEIALDCGGYKVVLTDTAGLRETDDAVEAIGIGRTRAKIENADCVLWLDPKDAPLEHATPDTARTSVRLRTKSDLLDDRMERYPTPRDRGPLGPHGQEKEIRISCITGEGLGELRSLLARLAADAAPRETVDVPVSERHAAHLRAVRDTLATVTDHLPGELVAEQLQEATRELGRITGATDIEDVYGAIFSRFCMGK